MFQFLAKCGIYWTYYHVQEFPVSCVCPKTRQLTCLCLCSVYSAIRGPESEYWGYPDSEQTQISHTNLDENHAYISKKNRPRIIKKNVKTDKKICDRQKLFVTDRD